MRKLFYLTLLILLSFFLTSDSNSQVNQLWKWMHPKPQGNTLRYVKALSATNWYAIGYAGTCLWTTNAGANWINYTNAGGVQSWGLGRSAYTGWFFNATTGLFAGGSGWIARTTNGGVNWDSIYSGTTATIYGMHFINSTTGFIGTYSTSTEVMKTTDGGLTWDTLPIPTSYYSYNIFALNENYIYAPASSSGNLMVTTDGGTTWTTKATGASTLYDAFFFSPDTGFVCGSSGNIRLTTNGGTTWASVAVPSITSAYYELKGVQGATRDIYVIGDPFNIYKSTNLGTNWTAIDMLDPSSPWTSTWYSMDIFGTTMIAVGASGQFNRSTNSGANWTTFNTWLSAGTFYDVWAEYNDKKVWVVGSPGISGTTFDQILYSSNGGTNWVNQPITSTKYFRTIHMVNTSTGYIAGYQGAVYKTTNGGSNWDSLPFPTTTPLLYKVDFPTATTGWVVSTSTPYIWKSTDGGMNWASQTGPTTSIYSIDMVDANTGYFCGSSGSVRKTTDGGTTWSLVTINTTSTLYDVKMMNALTGFICGSSSAVRRTRDGGTTWDTLFQPYSATLYGMDWVDTTSGIVVASSTGYTARTTNAGGSWTIETTSGSTMYNVYMRHRDSAWACGSGSYVFKYAIGPTGITQYEHNVPRDFVLMQNYPNPFNPNTTIKFGLPRAGSVTLNVYDITGKLVQKILNNAPLNAGTVTHDFDGTNLASGVYFYSLIVDDIKIDTKKMVLVK